MNSPLMMNIHYNVVCIGAGGTGGNFSKEFARYLSNLKLSEASVSFSLVDGDKVEEKNLERQPFSEFDVALNKAVSLVEAIQDVFGLKEIYSYPEYINSAADIAKIVDFRNKYKYTPDKGSDVVILIGGVDNHRARQAMDSYFYTQKNIIYVDSANEFSFGEICIGVRFNGYTMSPPRAYYFPDVLTDTSPSASEISCGAMNISTPQHISTNLVAAHLILALLANIISNNKVDYGIIYFDSLKYFSRFDRYEGPILEDKENEEVEQREADEPRGN